MALVMVKARLLNGIDYAAGEVIPPPAWAGLTERTRKSLTRTRLVRSTDLTPVARTECPPVALTTPRLADGPTRGRKPQKGA
jgi:hypothetical protein